MQEQENKSKAAALRDILERESAFHFHGNRMPVMSGDSRERLSSFQERQMNGAIDSFFKTIAEAGYKIVPAEPTDSMIKACLRAALDFMEETKTTEVHPGQTYPSPTENARRCWAAMLAASECEFNGRQQNDQSIRNPSNPSAERHSRK